MDKSKEYSEWLKYADAERAEDILELRKVKEEEKKKKSIPLDRVKNELNL